VKEATDPTPMRLGYVVGTFPVVSTTFIARELQTLRALGHSTTVVSLRRPPVHERAPDADVTGAPVSYLLPVSLGWLLRSHLTFALRRPGAYFGTLRWLLTRPHPSAGGRLRTGLHFGEGVAAAAVFEAAGVDLIHAHFVDRAATVALVVGRLLGLPYSVTAHANDIYRRPLLLEQKLGQAAFAVTVSDANRRHLLEACPGLAPDRLHVIHGWVDPAAWRPSRDRSRAGPARIVSVGRLVDKKGHADLIEACAHLAAAGTAVECDIVGEGPLRARLEVHIEQAGLRGHVRLLGARSGSEVKALLDDADLFVLACVVAPDGDRDGMPVALAEAMAMGLPVVSTELPGIDELVRPGTGILVPQHDVRALAEAIDEIGKASPGARAAMGRAGRAVVLESFVVAAGVDRLVTLFRAAIARSSAPSGNELEGDASGLAASGAGRR